MKLTFHFLQVAAILFAIQSCSPMKLNTKLPNQSPLQNLTDCNKAIEKNPNDANAYNIRGNMYSEMEEYDKAIIDYSKAIELNPNFDYAYSNSKRSGKYV